MAVLGSASLLATAVACEPLARHFRVPLSLVLTLVGAILGLGMSSIDAELRDSLILSSEAFLYLFLPVLLFETAIEIDVRRLLADLGPILALAVIAVLVTTFVVGLALAATSSFSLLACLLVAAIISTTDPVAVVALFKDLSVPHRLSLLVEGESLLNDAAAIALFSVLLAMLTGGSGTWSHAWSDFLRSFCGGILVGFILAQSAIYLLPSLRNQRLAEISLTLAVAYLAFITGEHGFHVSGVVAVVMSALAFAYSGRTRLSPETWDVLVDTWKQLGYWASALIFLLAAVRIPELLEHVHNTDGLMVGTLVVSALLARALVLFGLLPLLCRLGLAQRVEPRLRLVILWGGLRGAISLALVLAVLEHPGVPPEIKRLVATLATAFVLFTLFVNGLTLKPLVRALKLDRLGPVDLLLREHAIAHGLSTVQARIDEAAIEYRIDNEAQERLAADYRLRLNLVETHHQRDIVLPDEQRLRAALITTARREQTLYYRHFRDRIVAGSIVRNLVAAAYGLEDQAKVEGHAGYTAAAQAILAFPWSFRLALSLHRRLGWDYWLANALADRLESLLVARATVHDLQRFAARRFPSWFGANTAQSLDLILEERLTTLEDALAALRLQYGPFTAAMQLRYLERAALRIEDVEYRHLWAENVISREVYDDLQRDLAQRWRQADHRPALELDLDPLSLLARVPLFSTLEPAALRAISPLLRPRFVVPGELIIRQGDRAREMFFLVSGAVEVGLPQTVRLGSGGFFGELALIYQERRSANITALGYCELLVLAAHDFNTLLEQYPDIKAQVTQTARQRKTRIFPALAPANA